MTKHNTLDSMELTRKLEQFYTFPEASEPFKIQLGSQLEQRRLHLIENVRSRPTSSRVRKFLDSLFAPYKPATVKFGIGILTALAGLLVFSGLVYAIVTTFNIYIPGLGFANRESQVRSLADPVTQTREGVTVTIKQVLLTPEKTSLVMTIQGLGSGAMITEDDSREAHERSCNASPEIVLPDGTLLSPTDTGELGYDATNAYQRVFFYPPISESVRKAQLQIPCVYQTRAGGAPEDWQMPLSFISASPDLTIAPIIEATQPEQSAPDTTGLLALDQVIQTASNTIFTGRFSPLFEGSSVIGIKDQAPQIRDANGKALPWRIPSEINHFTDEQGVYHWAYQVDENDIAWPISIQFDAVDLRCTSQTQFEFDPDQVAELGQVWEVDKALSIGACDIKLVSIKKNQSGYTFRIASDENPIQDVKIEILGQTLTTSSQVLKSSYDDVSLTFADELPAGRLTIQFADVTIQIPGPWQVQWSPENEGVK
jgi:hypothetical protein